MISFNLAWVIYKILTKIFLTVINIFISQYIGPSAALWSLLLYLISARIAVYIYLFDLSLWHSLLASDIVSPCVFLDANIVQFSKLLRFACFRRPSFRL